MSRVELFEKIRRDSRDLGLSVRGLAAKHHVHRRVVRQALASAVPPERQSPERTSPVLGQWKVVIDQILEADRSAPPKQRHTARRIWVRLRDEHGADVAESTVRAYVGTRRRELANVSRVVCLPQLHNPGDEAQCGKPHRISYVERATMRRPRFLDRVEERTQQPCVRPRGELQAGRKQVGERRVLALDL